MSTPASICCWTTSATAARTRASNAAASGALPASSASSVDVRSRALGRLPVCVVKMRSVLSFIVSPPYSRAMTFSAKSSITRYCRFSGG